MSAILLPIAAGRVDWRGFDAHVQRTFDHGLVPAVNMDTGYANLIEESLRVAVLKRTQELADGRLFVGGAYVADACGSALNLDGYRQQVDSIETYGGQPILFQSFGLTEQSDEEILVAYEAIATSCDRFLAFELGTMFAPFGKIYSAELYRHLISIPNCLGAKHSSLDRQLEWERLAIRDAVRPDFQILTGNDLAIDMVFYGSDYLLGLSTFAPDLFALRDRMWVEEDPRVFELNDLLQYLGCFAFRDPVPAYKHSAAQFLKIRGWIETDEVFPGGLVRPDSDREILLKIWDQIQAYL
jgi:dihydrodipicolinate synthase/N-acetylneuraminate lyase